MSTRAIGYVRVSTEKQATEGMSLETQRAKLAQYAALYDIELVTIVEDAQSGGTIDRPGLQAALSQLGKNGVDTLLVVKLDRLTRSVVDMGVLVKDYFQSKYSLVSVSEQLDTRSAGGRLVMNVLMSIFAWEREAIGERTAAVAQYMKANGKYTGGRVPYGKSVSTDGSTLVDNPEELATLNVVRELRDAGRSFRDIAVELGRRGYTTRTGKPFMYTAIPNMLAAVAPKSAP